MAQSISKTLIIRLFLIIACVNISISLFLYFYSVRLAETEFQATIQVEVDQLADIFTHQLWLFDLRTTEKLAESALNNPDIRWLRLHDQMNNIVAEKGLLDQAQVATDRRKLIHQSGAVVGEMEIAYFDSNKDKQKDLVLKISILTVLATLLVTTLFIFYALRKHLILPLKVLQEDMSQVSDGKFKQSHLVGQKKEIQSIIEVFNQMASSLSQREKDQHRLESELRQKYKMEAIGTMAGGIAHDFNNLLSIIIGNLELAKSKLLSNGDPGKNIENIKKASDRATDLISQILAFSRSSDPILKVVDLKDLILTTVKLLRSTIPTTVEIDCSLQNSPTYVDADKTQLQQVIMNLCTNAVHAMDEKGKLSVSLSREALPHTLSPDAEGIYAKLVVKDTGTGMDEETISKIFDPFFTTKESSKGTGMGLSTVHGIVRQHNGFISVDSTPLVGSEFSVYLPTTKKITEKSTEDKDSIHPTGNEKILLVDDEKAITETNTEFLSELGYEVTGVINSEDALKIFSQEPGRFDLVITDQTMPKISGIVLSEELLKIRSDIPIILLSGFSAIATDEKAKEIGICAFLRKPLSNKLLAKTVRDILDRGKLQ